MSNETKDPPIPTVHRSLRSFARAVERHHSTLSQWLRREDFPVRKSAPWTDADVRTVKEWSLDLQADRNYQHERPADNRQWGGFWNIYGRFDVEPIPRHEHSSLLASKDWRDMPPLVMSRLERDVLEGKRKLSPAQVQKLVERFVHYRAVVAVDVDEMPPAFHGYTLPEIRERLRSAFYTRLLWVREAIDNDAGYPSETPDEDEGGDGE
jgi:hypothetical protein